MAGKFGANMGMGETPLGEPYLQEDVHVPPRRSSGPSGTMVRMWNGWYHWRWRANISCSTPSQIWGSWYLPGFLFGGHLWPLLWSWWSSRTPYPLWRNCPIWWNGHVIGIVINEGGGSKMFLVSAPKGPASLTNVPHCSSWMVTLTTSSGKYGPPRGTSPHIHISAKFSCYILFPKLVSIIFP